MTLTIKLTPIKQLFSNPSNGYRIISCIASEYVPNLELNNYGNFTLSGSNLSNLALNTEYELEIRKDERSKYPASYVLVGWAGVEIGENITIKPEQEIGFLSMCMERVQAERVHEAYPNFVQMVLDGRENELDYKNIYNVGPVRFESYINAIKGHFHALKFYTVAHDWDITDVDTITELSKIFATPEELKDKLDDNPYNIFIDQLHYPFAKTDRLILSKRPEMIDSLERCEYGCLEILRKNELEGDTRIEADLLMEMAEEIVPETVDHLEEAVENCKTIFYDAKTGYSSKASTYNDEQFIADSLMERINNPENLGMDYTNFTVVDGFECTEQQIKILDLANRYKACMLRGYSGTGKSTVMKALVLMLEAYGKDYVMLAPTGKAAARLRETTGRHASTIHMYLATAKDSCYCPDFVIVDECSMVGVELMAKLLAAVPKSRLVFVCDEAQLASISCGNVVQDIIDSGKMPQANLTKVFRYGSSGLATIATDTRNGKLGPRTPNNGFTDYQFHEVSDDPIGQILEMYGDLLDQGYTKDDILILCPYNKTKLGTYTINEAIQARYNNHPFTNAEYKIGKEAHIKFKVGDKVINTHNEYHMPCFEYDEDGSLVESMGEIMVMNGDIGYVRYIKETELGIVMAVEFESGMAKISGSKMTNLLLGYAISIHKSQGSQAKVVIVVTDKIHKRMLTRNLLYVADSRARELLIEIGDVGAIEEGLERQENKDRDTWLREMLENYDKEED